MCLSFTVSEILVENRKHAFNVPISGGPSLNLAAVYMKNLGSWGNQVTKQFMIHNTGI